MENTIKHGSVEYGKSDTVLLHTEGEDNNIVITVADNSVEFAPGMLEKIDSVGIKNVCYRLEMMLGGTLMIESEPSRGTMVTI